MKRFNLILTLVIATFSLSQAQVTYSEHIAPIIYKNCTSCHRQGEIGPMPFTNYNEVMAWAGMIQYTTEIKYMPPWQPDKTFSTFVGEKGLTDAEIQLIKDWVAAGTPQGDPALEPPLPVFPSGSQLGSPDLVLEMSEDYFIEGNNTDDYRVFVLPTGLTQDREIAAIEFRPGNSKAVHHALIAYETNGAGAAMDAQTPEYGFESFGSFGVPTQGTFTGYTPGIQPLMYPEGVGITLPAGADLLVQVHYAPLPTDETDRSRVNIFFKDPTDTITREVQRPRITPFNLDGGFASFRIPPDTIIDFHGTWDVVDDISFISIYPHMHYLGKFWELFAVTPTNDTINIIRINQWDFNWQGAYTFDRMKKIPAGSVVHVNASYDNTANNPYNPSNPPVMVTWGEGTKDEMYLVGTEWVEYRAGDENIVIGGNVSTGLENVSIDLADKLYLPYPNPSSNKVSLNFYLKNGQPISIVLIDAKGSVAKSIISNTLYAPGNHKIVFNVDDLPAGTYTVRLNNGEGNLTKPLIITD